MANAAEKTLDTNSRQTAAAKDSIGLAESGSQSINGSWAAAPPLAPLPPASGGSGGGGGCCWGSGRQGGAGGERLGAAYGEERGDGARVGGPIRAFAEGVDAIEWVEGSDQVTGGGGG